MTDCVKVEQSPGCVTRANGETENILIVREYGVGSNGQAVLARTHLTDINGDHITLAAGDIARIGACLRCCGSVLIEDLIPVGNKIATITTSEGQAFDLNETITTFSTLYNDTNGIKIGEYTNEEGTVVEVFGPKQSIDVNLTPIAYVPTATGNTANLGQVVVDPNGTIWIIDQEGDAQQMQMPAFKELNRFYADPAGNDGTGTGANEKPFATAQAAVDALGQADTAILNEGTYGAVTMATPNTTLTGASNGYSGLVQIASLTATATGTSVRAEGLTVTGNVSHTGAAPLYLNNVTVNGNYASSSTAYTEIKDSRIQDGTISKTAAGTLFIRDSQIGNATFSTPNSVVALRNVNIDTGDKVTIDAGVFYSLHDVVGEVEINPAAVSVESAVLASGGTAAQAEGAVTSHFMQIRMHTPDTEASPTKMVTWDEATGELEISEIPSAGNVGYSDTAPVSGTTAGTEGQVIFVTQDGLESSTPTEGWIYDATSSTWSKMPGGVTTKTTTSLTAQYGNGTAHVNALASAQATVADVIKLSDGTLVNNEDKVTWTGHGLAIHNWYFLSATTAGGYTNTPPSSPNLSQRLFYVEDANTIKINIQEALATDTAATTGVVFRGSYSISVPLANSGTIVGLSNISLNTVPSAWNNSTGTFTAPTTGFYLVALAVSAYASLAQGQFLEMKILKNNNVEQTFLDQANAAGGYNLCVSGTVPVYLVAGDTLKFGISSSLTLTSHVNSTYFSITQL